jgi:hypothetical protein
MSTIEVGGDLELHRHEGIRRQFWGIDGREVAPPVEGARFDVAFEGTATGQKRELITSESARMAALSLTFMKRSGRRMGGIADVRVNMTLFASSKRYTWVNQLQVWGIGTLDLAKQVIEVAAYSA